MLNRTQFQIALGIAVAVWAGMLLLQGVTLKATYLRPYSIAVSAVVLCFFAFDHWLWRSRPIDRITRSPVLRGTWKGTLTSTWIDPSTGAAVPAIPVYLVVHQTYSAISTSLITGESTSRSLVASLDTSRNAPATVSSTYRNTPQLLVQDRSRIHHGALMLEVHGGPPERLSGWYWTDRDTKGELRFEGHSPKLHTDFAGALADHDLA